MDFGPIKDWWWFILSGFGLFVVVVRNVIKIHEAVEALKRVSEHDKKLILIATQYTSIEQDTKELKEGMTDLAASLDKHVVEQKGEFMAINSALYTILDLLKKDDASGTAEAALKELRKYTLGK